VTEDLQAACFTENSYAEHLIASGPLLSDDGTEWAGTATLVALPKSGSG
jgi:hypothetical protein